MKRSLAIVAFVASAIVAVGSIAKADDSKMVHAVLAKQEVKIWFSGIHSFYSCDYAQRETEKTLAELGARAIKVTCTGGLPYDRFVDVTARFSSIREAAADKSTMMAQMTNIIVQKAESCDLHEEILRNVVPAFEVYAKEARNSCWDSKGVVTYNLTVLH